MKSNLTKNNEAEKDLNEVIEQITKHSDKQTRHIQSLTRIGVALSSVTNLEKIFDLILEEAISFTNADAATIYKVSEDKQSLEFVIVYNKSLNLRMGGTHSSVLWKNIPLFDKESKPQLKYIVTNVYHKKRLLCFKDVYKIKDYDVSGTEEIDSANNYISKSMLTLPLKNHEDEVLGILQVINALDKNGKIIAFKDEHIVMLKSLASQAAITMSNRKLINDLETLLMQFMQSIAKGIERKSKYSSNHIIRVSLLTDMIAQRLNDNKSGKFSKVNFSANELKELSMAGLMHDIGKIVTPDFVMDKSTKLEAVTDRIQIVNLRFELFKKALALYKNEHGEAQFLKKAEQWYPQTKLKNFKSLLSKIDADKEFLRIVNQGSEAITEDILDHIRRIKKMEIEFDGQNWFLLSEEEYSNLQIRRGTLSVTERKTMDEHVLVTWEMLSELSFPNKYKNVALYAASHHEKLNGTGHPFGLKEIDIPLQSRILAIADIYEALTAADRPYTKGKKLSEALKILAFCAKDKEIDSDLMDFLIDSGLYLEFARKYMKPEQIDAVDVKAIKKIYHPELKK